MGECFQDQKNGSNNSLQYKRKFVQIDWRVVEEKKT